MTAVEFDAVIVPGGYAPDMMRRHDGMVKLVREAAQQGKVVAATCHAGWMLASASVVKGKKVVLLLHQRTVPRVWPFEWVPGVRYVDARHRLGRGCQREGT